MARSSSNSSANAGPHPRRERSRYRRPMTDDIAAQLARVEAEEAEVVLPRFAVTDAWALSSRMREAAATAGLSMVIGIPLGEARVFPPTPPGSSADNVGCLDRKPRVARRYGRSSFRVALSFRSAGGDIDT